MSALVTHSLNSSYSSVPNEQIRAIRQLRQDDSAKEVQRLIAAGCLHFEKLRVKLNDSCLARLGQAIEIKRIYQKTHDVVIHATERSWLPFQYLVKELVRKNKDAFPDIQLHDFKFLRSPHILFHPSSSEGIKKYKSKDTHDREQGTGGAELAACDAYYHSYTPNESALDMLESDVSFYCNTIDQTEKLVKYFYPSCSWEEVGVREVHEMRHEFMKDTQRCGDLAVFCVPKEEREKILYLAHPYGGPCECHPDQDPNTILEQLQNDHIEETVYCSYKKEKVPQVRVYLPEMKPDGKHPIFLLTPFSKAQRKALKVKVREFVDKIHETHRPTSKTTDVETKK